MVFGVRRLPLGWEDVGFCFTGRWILAGVMLDFCCLDIGFRLYGRWILVWWILDFGCVDVGFWFVWTLDFSYMDLGFLLSGS